MAKFMNCVSVTCDRCGYSEYYPSLQHAENVNWEFDVNVDDGMFDLCPKCGSEWNKVVHNFIYRDGEVDYRIKKALEVAWQHGQNDAAHHKAWAIDQMVRRLLGDDYEEWIENYKHDDSGEFYNWYCGIAP